MKHIEIKIGDEIVKDFLKNSIKSDDVTVEFEDGLLRIVLINKVMGFLNIPVSVTLRFVEGQKDIKDPVLFNVEANKLILKLLQKYEGNVIKFSDKKLKIYPHRIFKRLKNFLVKEVGFSEKGYLYIILEKLEEKIDGS